MLLNENVVISGSKCMLVPYTKDLVETYHGWFVCDAELLDLTGSDLLSLEGEFVNQESWRTDPEKLTFLIRDLTLNDSPLCGDINAFFSEFYVSDWTGDDAEPSSEAMGKVAEINLMIAEKTSRRKGIAEDALRLFTEYVVRNVDAVKLFVAKIQIHNAGSIALFEKLGFSQFKRVECFNEVHYIYRVGE